MSNVDGTINEAPETTEQTAKPKTTKKAKPGSVKKTKTAAKPTKTAHDAAKAPKSAAAKKAVSKKSKRTDGAEGSKKAIILEMLRRKEGATIGENALAAWYRSG